MATYTRVSGDYNIVSIDPTVDNVNVTTSSLNVTGNLNVAGNITYITVESFKQTIRLLQQPATTQEHQAQHPIKNKVL